MLGLGCVALGAISTSLGLTRPHSASLGLFLVGGGITGAGVGVLFRASLATASWRAAAHRRGEALAAIFLIASAGMTVPPLLTAAALTLWPAIDVLVTLVTLAAVLVAVSG